MLSEMASCKASDPAQDRSPCNRFVGKALEKVWGLRDFRTEIGNGKDEFYGANHIAAYVAVSQPPWKFVGLASNPSVLAYAQQLANDSVPVIAVRTDTPGHVALILPGRLSFSTNWNTNVPNSASFLLDDPKNSYVGKRLSSAFRPEMRSEVKIYYRLGQ
jgi:hypothetical protein